MNSANSCGNPPERSRRHFDTIVIALSSALLVILGIVVGRFIVTTQAVAVVDRFDGELTSLRAEIADLNRQLQESESRAVTLEESLTQYRQLAQQQIRAETLSARQQSTRSALASLMTHRETCLDQVQQYVALNQSVPPLDVLRFAEAMFDSQQFTLGQLSDSGAAPSTLPAFPAFPPVAAAMPAEVASAPLASPQSTSGAKATYPELRAPGTVQAETTHRSTPPAKAEFFSPPPRRQQPGSYTYFAPRREAQALSMPRQSGITFHDTASVEDGAIRR